MPLLLPKDKKRTALLGKLKAIFRASRSQPVGGVIEKIHPILTGLGPILRHRPLEPVFLLRPRLGRKEDPETSGPSVPASRLRLEAVEQGMVVRHAGPVFGVPRLVS